MSPPRPESRFARALAGAPDAPVAFGLSFAPPQVLGALARLTDAHTALPRICDSLRLEFVFVEREMLGDLVPILDAGCEPLAVVPGPLGRVMNRVGFADALLATVREPESLAPHLALAEDDALGEIDEAQAAGASAIVIAEDLAGTEGPLLAPDYAMAEVFPSLARLVERAADAGLPSILHTDGDARVFAPSAARAGFAALHGGGALPRQRLDGLLQSVRAAGLAFVGGILTSELGGGQMRAIAAGSVAGVQGLRGGFLVCDDGGMSTVHEAHAFVAALEAARHAAEGGGRGR